MLAPFSQISDMHNRFSNIPSYNLSVSMTVSVDRTIVNLLFYYFQYPPF